MNSLWIVKILLSCVELKLAEKNLSPRCHTDGVRNTRDAGGWKGEGIKVQKGFQEFNNWNLFRRELNGHKYLHIRFDSWFLNYCWSLFWQSISLLFLSGKCKDLQWSCSRERLKSSRCFPPQKVTTRHLG